jgi:hypothetical protein
MKGNPRRPTRGLQRSASPSLKPSNVMRSYIVRSYARVGGCSRLVREKRRVVAGRLLLRLQEGVPRAAHLGEDAGDCRRELGREGHALICKPRELVQVVAHSVERGDGRADVGAASINPRSNF